MSLPQVNTVFPQILLSGERFSALNVFGAPGPLAVVPAPPLPGFDPQAVWPKGISLFIPFSDPENVGSAIRAAAGLAAARVVLLREAACPYLPKAVRAAAGALWKIRLEAGPALADLNVPSAIPLWALDMRGVALDAVARQPVMGLVAGLEGQGLPDNLRTRCQRTLIPMANGIESLNAAAAVAVALWAWRPAVRPAP